MQSEVLGNIPRLYTALADWLACLLYLFFLPKRTAGWRRYTIHAVFLLLLGVFMQATGQVPQFWFLPCIAVSILIMYLYIRMQAGVPEVRGVASGAPDIVDANGTQANPAEF